MARRLGVEGNGQYALAILLTTLLAKLRLYPNTISMYLSITLYPCLTKLNFKNH